MKHYLSLIITLILFMWSTAPAQAAESEPVDTGKVVASLVSSHDSIAPGETLHIALRTVLDDHWHTYWRNPGDSGEPVQIDWILPEGISASGDIFWPVPRTIATGPIINYGFEGAPLFPQAFTIDSALTPGTVLDIGAEVYYLVCKDVCIPEQATLALSLTIDERIDDTRWGRLIDISITESPSPTDMKGGIEKSGDTVSITIANTIAKSDSPSDSTIDYSTAYFFPYDQGVLGHSNPQNIRVNEKGLRLETTPDYLWDNAVPETLSGVLTYQKDGEIVGDEITLTVGTSPDIGFVAAPNSVVGGGGASITLVSAIIGAFLGGIILNLMPCVFPVISIKALSIAKTAHGERAQIRREAWLYTAGVIATFLALTALLLGLKAAGSEIGWGFQLQNPKVVAALAVLLFVIGLNLLGVFEIGTSLQNTGGSLVQKQGWSGSFFTGALAVIVATPCTAPFMAGAVGYALAQPGFVTVAVFLALAIGFAAPFLLIAYVPGLLAKLPKPGPWMERFRQFLAFPMLAASVWLIWVLSLQAGEDGVLFALLSMLLVGFAIWLLKDRGIISRALGGLSILAALILPISINAASVSHTVEIGAEVWSVENVRQRRADGKTIFVDFTAAWCVTCKVNEKVVLDRPGVKALFADDDVVFMVADWTNKNDEIAQELARHGRSGVPLYLVYSPGQNSVKPQILPQVLTENLIREAIVRAKSG